MFFPTIETIWNDGLLGEDYFPSLAYYRHLVVSLYRDIAVDPTDADAVAQALDDATGNDRGNTRIVVVTEDWCGDSAVTVPYIARLAEAVGVELRIFRQSVFTELKQWYVDDGASHIPTVSVIHRGTASFDELFRWIERPADAHGKVKQWVADHPEFTELRGKKDDDPAAEKEYFKLYAKLLRDMAGWYRRGLWRSIAAEFAAGLLRQ
jgi:hypothetical protein